ncbi:MAG TPA: glycosyltransferase [Polyangiaceae bacterium]|nr:glycosyltransferase [Polyangiaceae bacterium]
MALARQGFRVSIVTLEIPEALADVERVAATQRTLSDVGVSWLRAPFLRGGSPAVYSKNVLQLLRLALTGARPAVAWIRGFTAGPIALALRARGVRFIYDIRGFWVDQRSQSDGWPPIAIAAGRALESLYYRNCSAVVSLTALGAGDVKCGRFGPWPKDKPAIVIPTCVDYDDFAFERRRTMAELDKKLVLGFVGSVNSDYLVEASVELFARVSRLRDDARLLCISGQHDVVRRLARAAGVAAEKVIGLSASHDRMPGLLAQIDWGLLLLKTSDVKRGSMPTKLAEFFASGVRPVHFGCNEEVGEWVARTESGFSLPSLNSDALDDAARRIATSSVDESRLRRAREIAEPHFSLASGTTRYASLIRSLMS